MNAVGCAAHVTPGCRCCRRDCPALRRLRGQRDARPLPWPSTGPTSVSSGSRRECPCHSHRSQGSPTRPTRAGQAAQQVDAHSRSRVQVWDAVSWIGMDRAADMLLVMPPSRRLPFFPASAPARRGVGPEKAVPVKPSEFRPNPVRSLVPTSHASGDVQPFRKGKVRSRFDSSFDGVVPPLQFPESDQLCHRCGSTRPGRRSVGAGRTRDTAPNTPTNATVDCRRRRTPRTASPPCLPFRQIGTAGAVPGGHAIPAYRTTRRSRPL